MDGQTPSYNPKERNLRINSKVLQPLEELEEKLREMSAEIIKKGDVNNAKKAFTYAKIVDLINPRFYFHYGAIYLEHDEGDVVASCKSIESTLSPSKITCRNFEKDESFEIPNDYLPKMRDTLERLLNTIYWESETGKKLARDFGISPYEREMTLPSFSKIYAWINLTKERGKPTIEIYENPYYLYSGTIRYKMDKDDSHKIDIHYLFL